MTMTMTNGYDYSLLTIHCSPFNIHYSPFPTH